MRARITAKRSKYHAQPTVVDGVRFASKREAKRYRELKLLERAGEIRDLELQPRYPIEIRKHVICTYVADFRYRENADKVIGGHLVVEDVKGMKTPVYRLKKKLMAAVYGIEVREL